MHMTYGIVKKLCGKWPVWKIYVYEGCSKSIGPLVGKNTIIYLDV